MKKILFSIVALLISMSINAQFVRVYKDGKAVCTQEKADSVVFTQNYHESEPATPTEEDEYIINRVWDEHAEVVMESNIEKSEEEEELFCQGKEGELVFFRIYYDAGYEWTVEIKGQSGTVCTYQWYEKNDPANRIGLASYGFYMPAEAVTITVKSTPKSVFDDKGFVGEYQAFMIPAKSTDGYLVRISKGYSTSRINVYGNGSFQMTSPDLIYDYESGGTTFHVGDTHAGLYTCENDKNLEYVTVVDSVNFYRNISRKWGMKAIWYGGDDMMAYALYLDDQSINSTHHYFASKERFEYVCVPQDVYGTRYVFEITKPSGKHWFYYYPETYQFEELTTTDLSSDQSINNYCDVEFSNADGKYIRLINSKEGQTFRFKTDEEGTYTNADVNVDLYLDGLGKGKYGEDKGTYTVDGRFITFTYEKDQTVQEFTINRTAKTYILGKELNWHGALRWSQNISAEETGAYWDGTATQAVIDIWLDHDYSDNEKPGFAKIKVDCYRAGYAEWKYGVIASTVSYTYDAANNVMTLLNVPMTWYSSYMEDVILTYDEATGQFVGKEGEMLCFGGNRYIDEGKIKLRVANE